MQSQLQCMFCMNFVRNLRFQRFNCGGIFFGLNVLYRSDLGRFRHWKKEKNLFYSIILHEEIVTVLFANSLTSYILRDPSQLANRLPQTLFHPSVASVGSLKFHLDHLEEYLREDSLSIQSRLPFSREERHSDFILRDLPRGFLIERWCYRKSLLENGRSISRVGRYR